MNDARLRSIAGLGLGIGATLGVVGAFVPSSSWRGLAWGLDGSALVVAAATLVVYHARRGNDVAAAGFLIFAIGQGLVLSGAPMDLAPSGPSFGTGAGLWAAGLVFVGAARVMPGWVNGIGYVAAMLLAVVAVQIYMGSALTPLSRPLPFFAYPFLAVTLLGWAWTLYGEGGGREATPG